MIAQESASRILAAWLSGNSEQLRSEVEVALTGCFANGARSAVENEEQELLETVAHDLSKCLGRSRDCADQRLYSSLNLLRHLSRRNHPSSLNRSFAS